MKGVVLSALANSELPFSQVLQALSEDQEFLEETSVLQTAFNLELKADAPEDSLAECITVSTGHNSSLWPVFSMKALTNGCLWCSDCIVPY